MPTPRKGETQSDFVSRCIPVVLREGTAKDQKQAAAICHSMWRESKKENQMRQWFTMQASTEAATADILIYDEIGKSFWGEETIGAKTFVDNLEALGDVQNINLRIN